MHGWYPRVINIFTDETQFGNIKRDKLDSFYTSVSTLISNQVGNYVHEPLCFEYVYNIIFELLWPIFSIYILDIHTYTTNN